MYKLCNIVEIHYNKDYPSSFGQQQSPTQSPHTMGLAPFFNRNFMIP